MDCHFMPKHTHAFCVKLNLELTVDMVSSDHDSPRIPLCVFRSICDRVSTTIKIISSSINTTKLFKTIH